MVQRPEIRTERLLLRPWRFSDIDDAFAYASDPEWSRCQAGVNTRYEDTAAFVIRASEDSGEDGIEFAIEFEDRAIGGIGLRVVNASGRTASLGYGIAREHWSKGFATEAALAVIGYGFRTLGYQRIFATADSRNLASVHVLRKLGMRQEAFLRRHRFHRGEHSDEVWYSVLAEEFIGL